jgi:glutamate N-acetyltransferase/amino-acid N-acetyltransferase
MRGPSAELAVSTSEHESMSDESEFTVPAGFRAAGVRAGIKPSGAPDLAVFIAERPCAAAGLFTTNRVAAAPVKWCRAIVPSDRVRAVVVNAGNANAATGAAGLADARRMAEAAAQRIGCEAAQVLIASTGVIGRPLPMDRVEAGIDAAVREADAQPESFDAASRAIMTTDTRPKLVARTVETASGPAVVLGIAKGAAMIGPNLATMLAFVLTDARVGPGTLQGILSEAVDESFHCLTVEGHTSTNDTVLLLASGGDRPALAGDDLAKVAQAVRAVCIELARAIADDAEGASHRVTIEVAGCRDRDEAMRIARSIAEDALVKTAIAGADPNWGRIASAAGHAGVPFDEAEMSLSLNGHELYRAGAPLPFDEAAVSADLRGRRDTLIRLTFTRGDAAARFWTCDLTTEYVRLNADYTT